MQIPTFVAGVTSKVPDRPRDVPDGLDGLFASVMALITPDASAQPKGLGDAPEAISTGQEGMKGSVIDDDIPEEGIHVDGREALAALPLSLNRAQTPALMKITERDFTDAGSVSEIKVERPAVEQPMENLRWERGESISSRDIPAGTQSSIQTDALDQPTIVPHGLTEAARAAQAPLPAQPEGFRPAQAEMARPIQPLEVRPTKADTAGLQPETTGLPQPTTVQANQPAIETEDIVATVPTTKDVVVSAAPVQGQMQTGQEAIARVTTLRHSNPVVVNPTVQPDTVNPHAVAKGAGSAIATFLFRISDNPMGDEITAPDSLSPQTLSAPIAGAIAQNVTLVAQVKPASDRMPDPVPATTNSGMDMVSKTTTPSTSFTSAEPKFVPSSDVDLAKDKPITETIVRMPLATDPDIKAFGSVLVSNGVAPSFQGQSSPAPNLIPTQPPAQQVAHAMTSALRSGKTGQIDVILHPRELGQIRFEMVTSNEKIHVIVSAERPEAMDLIRRHTDQLMADLRQSGFGQATLGFGGWADRDQPKSKTGERAGGSAADRLSESDITPKLSPPPRNPTAEGRLDLRL